LSEILHSEPSQNSGRKESHACGFRLKTRWLFNLIDLLGWAWDLDRSMTGVPLCFIAANIRLD